jgi:hypothetical protein
LLASGWSPVYPCHVPPAQMRQHPVGTGPFKFVEFKPNESIKVARNPDYWSPGLPYLHGIEYAVIRNTSTAVLTLAAGKLDRTWPGIVPIALMREVNGQAVRRIVGLGYSGRRFGGARPVKARSSGNSGMGSTPGPPDSTPDTPYWPRQRRRQRPPRRRRRRRPTRSRRHSRRSRH